MAPTQPPPPLPESTNNTSVVPVKYDNEITVSPSSLGSASVDVDFPGTNQKAFDKKVETLSIKVLKQAFRKWKRSRKRGASLLVTRYTRHGKPVY